MARFFSGGVSKGRWKSCCHALFMCNGEIDKAIQNEHAVPDATLGAGFLWACRKYYLNVVTGVSHCNISLLFF